MKFIHTSDLHIGKKLHELSLYDEQKNFLEQILSALKTENADCLVIAGDVYDKSVPPAEAVVLFDNFITQLAEMNIPALIISGNHDSAERISFGSRIMEKKGIHFSPVYNGNIEPVVLTDSYGEVNFYMLPFIRPSAVRRFFEDREIKNYTDALNAVIEKMNVDYDKRNVIIAHQFVTGASCCDSEEISVGGIENVDSSVFDGFDYTALGHIHNPQDIGTKTVRYCGTPIKYSFSEENHDKSMTVVEIREKGYCEPKTIPFSPIHNMRTIKRSFEEICKLEPSDDYIHITLTDEEDVLYAMDKLRLRFSNLLWLDYDNKRTRTEFSFTDETISEKKQPSELFEEFFSMCNNSDMSDEQKSYMTEIINEIWGNENETADD